MTDTLAYPLAEAARVSGMSIDTLRKAIKAEQAPCLRAKKQGSKYIIRAKDLAAYIDSLPDA